MFRRGESATQVDAAECAATISGCARPQQAVQRCRVGFTNAAEHPSLTWPRQVWSEPAFFPQHLVQQVFEQPGVTPDIDSGPTPATRFLDHAGGIERLWAVCESWLSFVETSVLPGGYFFTGAFFQCAGQGGAIPRRITDIVRKWVNTLRSAVDEARSKGELRSEVDARQTALELNGILIGVKCSYLLGHGDRDRARLAVLAKPASLATNEIPASAFESVKRWRDYLETRHE